MSALFSSSDVLHVLGRSTAAVTAIAASLFVLLYVVGVALGAIAVARRAGPVSFTRDQEYRPSGRPKTRSRAGWLLAGLVAVALISRFSQLYMFRDAYLLTGLAQGGLAYRLVAFHSLDHGGPPSCGLDFHTTFQRLIDIQEHLENYERWCAEAGREVVPESGAEPYIAFAMPGPGILLAGTYYIFQQHRYIYLQVLLAALDAAGVLLVYGMTRQSFGRSAALFAALFYCLYLPVGRLVVIGGLRDAWMPILLLAALYSFQRAVLGRAMEWRWLFTAGAVVAVGCYFRPTTLALPLAWGFLLAVWRRHRWREAVFAVGVLCIPIVVLLAPWWIRNYQTFGRVILTNAGASVSLWAWIGESDNPFGITLSDTAQYEDYRRAGGTGSYFSLDYADDFYAPRYRALVRENPQWFAGLLWRRLVQVPKQAHDWGLDPFLYGDLFLRRVLRLSDQPIREPEWLRFRVQGAVTASIMLGALLTVICSPGRRWAGLVLASVAVYNVAIHVVIGPAPRYILPGNTGMLVLGGVFASRGLEWVFGRWRQGADQHERRMRGLAP